MLLNIVAEKFSRYCDKKVNTEMNHKYKKQTDKQVELKPVVFLIVSTGLQKICFCLRINFWLCTVYVNVLVFLKILTCSQSMKFLWG